MPQRYPDTLLPQLTNEDLDSRRPVYLLAGMSVVAQYSTVEATTSVLLTTLAGGASEPVAAIYGVLRQGQIQGKALEAVARTALEPPDLKLLRDVMKVARSASDVRDQIAHKLWFYDDQLPDAVVLSDPSLAWTLTVEASKAGGSGPTTIENAERFQKTMRDKSEVWRLSDFEAARLKCVHAVVGLTGFNVMIQQADPAAREKERQTILTVLTLAAGG